MFLITPTNPRLTQKAELTRLSQTLMHVKNLFWIVVEDFHVKTAIVNGILKRSGIPFVHLTEPKPFNNTINGTKVGGRGMLQRNRGLKWLRKYYLTHPIPVDGGVVYFADDDNTYDLRIFEEIRRIKVSRTVHFILFRMHLLILLESIDTF